MSDLLSILGGAGPKLDVVADPSQDAPDAHQFAGELAMATAQLLGAGRGAKGDTHSGDKGASEKDLVTMLESSQGEVAPTGSVAAVPDTPTVDGQLQSHPGGPIDESAPTLEALQPGLGAPQIDGKPIGGGKPSTTLLEGSPQPNAVKIAGGIQTSEITQAGIIQIGADAESVTASSVSATASTESATASTEPARLGGNIPHEASASPLREQTNSIRPLSGPDARVAQVKTMAADLTNGNVQKTESRGAGDATLQVGGRPNASGNDSSLNPGTEQRPAGSEAVLRSNTGATGEAVSGRPLANISNRVGPIVSEEADVSTAANKIDGARNNPESSDVMKADSDPSSEMAAKRNDALRSLQSEENTAGLRSTIRNGQSSSMLEKGASANAKAGDGGFVNSGTGTAQAKSGEGTAAPAVVGAGSVRSASELGVQAKVGPAIGGRILSSQSATPDSVLTSGGGGSSNQAETIALSSQSDPGYAPSAVGKQAPPAPLSAQNDAEQIARPEGQSRLASTDRNSARAGERFTPSPRIEIAASSVADEAPNIDVKAAQVNAQASNAAASAKTDTTANESVSIAMPGGGDSLQGKRFAKGNGALREGIRAETVQVPSNSRESSTVVTPTVDADLKPVEDLGTSEYRPAERESRTSENATQARPQAVPTPEAAMSAADEMSQQSPVSQVAGGSASEFDVGATSESDASNTSPEPALRRAVNALTGERIRGELVRFREVTGESGNVRFEASLRLHPRELGAIKIELQVDGDEMVARIIVESEAARAQLQSDIGQFRESLTEQGINSSRIDVLLAEGESGGENAEFGDEKSDGQTANDKEGKSTDQHHRENRGTAHTGIIDLRA